MNVLHIVLGLHTGGLERVVLDLIKHSSHSTSSFVCCLDDIGDHAGELEAMGTPYSVLGNFGKHKVRTLSSIRRLVGENKIDIIHTHNPSPHFYGSLAALISRVPVVHTKHGRNYPDSKRKVISNYLLSTISRKIVCVSSDAAKVALSVERIPAHKVMTILNGIEIEKYSAPAQPSVSERIELERDNVIIGIVARLSTEKDHATLLHAMSLIVRTRKDISLLIVGDGPLRSNLITLADKLHLSRHCHFLGNRRDVPDLLGIMDIFVLCSTTEGVSLTLLEAMAARIPIVCTDVGGNPEVVKHNESGLVVPSQTPRALADSILELVDSPETRRRMGQEGYRRVTDRFNIRTTVKEYESLYLSEINKA